jgi:hypothetical protein
MRISQRVGRKVQKPVMEALKCHKATRYMIYLGELISNGVLPRYRVAPSN